MAASMEGTAATFGEEQSTEISSSSGENGKQDVQMDVDHDRQENGAPGNEAASVITTRTAENDDSTLAERSSAVSGAGTAGMEGTGALILGPGAADHVVVTDSSNIGSSDSVHAKSVDESSSDNTAPLSSSFKMPFLPTKSLKTGSSSGNEDKMEISSSHESGDNKKSAATSSSNRSSSSSRDTFVFAMPKLLPKATHKAFEGSGVNLAQTSNSKKDESPESKPEEVAKTSPEVGKKDKAPAAAPPLPYKEPTWGGIPTEEYHLEVLKNGAIVSKIALGDKSFHVFGRLESCDVPLEHPSLSRYHMILQYRLTGDGDHDPGFYVYDLGSTHGSYLNKHKLNAKAYYRMKVGHMFKLAGSTRLYILQGPPDEPEPESELTITELKELRQKQLLEMEEQKRKKEEEQEILKKKKLEQADKGGGIDWGMGWDDANDDEDDEDEEPDEDNPFSTETQEEREAAYLKDPKKTLRGFFEREDMELEYDVDEKGSGFNHQYVCRVQLPLDDSDGNPIYAEAAVSGKKKEAVIACALEACRILDAHGVLRQATHESKKRKAKDWAQDDYYDSDDDTYLDRTGLIEKKRKQRMKKAGILQEKAETYESLVTRLSEVDAELEVTEKQLEEAKKAQPQTGNEDSLDAFIASLKTGGSSHDRAQRAKLKLRVVELRKEQFRLQKLVQLARPASMPEAPKSSLPMKGKALPMIGSMKSRTNFKDRFKPKIQISTIKLSQSANEVEIEEEEEEEEEEKEKEENTEVQTDPQKIHVEDMDVSSELDAKPAGKNTGTDEVMPRAVKGPQLPPSWSATHTTSPSQNIHKEPAVMTEKSKRTYGPTMGPSDYNSPETCQTSEILGQTTTASKDSNVGAGDRLVRGPTKGPSKSDFMRYYGQEEAGNQSVEEKVASRREREADETVQEGEEFSDWQPPTGQKGDGRTSLNDKLGY